MKNKQQKAYSHMFEIENILRVGMHNILIDEYGVDYFDLQTFPPFKYKKQKKEKNIIERVKNIVNNDKDSHLFKHVYPALWYLMYPDIIILLDVFWDTHFSNLFNIDKTLLTKNLRSIQTIRNDLAHNRYITNAEYDLLEEALGKIKVALKQKYLSNYIELATNENEIVIEKIVVIMNRIKKELAKKKIVKQEIISQALSAYSIIKHEMQINFDNDVERIMNLITEYNKLPRVPGAGGKIDDYLNTHLLDKIITEIINNFRRLV